MVFYSKILAFLFAISSLHAQAQYTILGKFPPLAQQQVKLVGFEGFDIYTIDAVKVQEDGSFTLNYKDKDLGMGYLAAEDNKAFFVILDKEGLQFEGEVLSLPETVKIISGMQNQLFGQYASEHPRREQALSAWIYLERMYALDTLFSIHALPREAIAAEKQRIRAEDQAFLDGLDPGSYVSWFLPTRKLVSSVSTIAQYRAAEIPETVEAFRKMDYTDARLYKSGLFKEAIESHFWLLENSGRSLDSVYIEMHISIDRMMEYLIKDEHKLNKVTDYLFNLLERHSLFGASEYLALKVLNEVSCTINHDLAAQLESYRAMKTGNTAPDFVLGGDVLAPGHEPSALPRKLSGLKNKYTVLVFAASWCPACPAELSQMAGVYQKWKNHDVEVVLVSLDENKQAFTDFAGKFPFISICDYLKWNSPVVKSYHVFGTPTLYLLDQQRTILLRPTSVRQMDAWVDWYLKQ